MCKLFLSLLPFKVPSATTPSGKHLNHGSAVFFCQRIAGKKLRKLESSILSLSLLLIFSGFTYLAEGQTTFVSATSGLWEDGTTWIGGVVPGITDNAVISAETTVSLQGSNATIRDLTIETGGVLNAENRTLTVNGKLVVDGTYTSKNAAAKDLEFNGTILEGAGSIIVDFVNRDLKINNSSVISASSDLSVYGNVAIGTGVTVTNDGTITITGDLKGNNGTTSVWTNAADSYLRVGKTLLTTGRLNASASGNSVEYNRAGDQDIKVPSASTYYNLIVLGSGNKNLLANIIISGDLTIRNSATLLSNDFNIDIRGNWNNTSIFSEGSGMVSFAGTSDQGIIDPNDAFFYNLTVNKGGGSILLGTNVIVSNTLAMANGIVNTESYKLILGTGVAALGTLSYTSGYINGKFERWINNTGTHLFPVGVSAVQQLWISLNGFISGGTMTAEFIASDPGNNGLSLDDAGTMIYNSFVEGYWSLSTDDGFNLGGGNDFNLQLSGAGFSSFIIDSETRILTRPDAGNNWIAEGNHLSGIGQTARRVALTTLPAQYALGDNTNCLRPVTSPITGTAEVCTGQNGVSYSVVNNPPNTYTWTIVGGTQASGGNTNSITVNWGISGIGNASVTVEENNTCTVGAPVTFPVIIHSVPPESITGKTNIAELTNGVPYSVPDRTGYTYNWTITGGTQTTGGNTSSIKVNWGTAGLGIVEVVAELAGCNPAPAISIDVRKYDVIESIASGDWDAPTTWDCNCVPLSTQSVRIRNGHTVNLHNSNSFEINNMIIDIGGTLDYNSRPFKVHGDFIVNGTYAGASTRVLTLDGVDKEIDGIGTVNGGFTIPTGNKTITSTSILSINAGNITLGNSVYLTNKGTVVLDGSLAGAAASSTWENSSNSVLKISGALLTTGTLRASALRNLVDYTGTTAAQAVKTPFNSTYYDLTLSGSTVKNLSGAVVVNGDITINGTSTFDVTAGNFAVSLKGDWKNNGATFNPRAGTVTFDGSSDQAITGTETFNNLTFSNATGNLILNTNVTVRGALGMAGGNIIAGPNIMRIGTDAGNVGSLNYTSGILIGKIERWVSSFGNLLFPVGETGSYNPANIYLNTISSSGSILGEFIPVDPGSAGLPQLDGAVPVSYHFNEGYWNFTALNGFASGNYNINLGANNFTSYTLNINSRVLKRTNSGNWTFDGTHAAAVPPTIYRNNLTGGISTLGTQFGVGFSCAPATITSSITHVKCFGGNDGAVNITVSGGAIPYSYSWAPGGATTEDISGLIAGSYGVTVTDANLCITPAIFTVLEPSQLLISDAVTNVSCGGTNDGAINITVTGGTAPYTYGWSTMDGSGLNPAAEDQSGLTAGTYRVLVLDSNGCSNFKDIVVLQSIIPVPGIAGPLTICQGSTGNVYTTEAGMTNYTWIVSPGGTITADGTSTDNSVTVTWTAPGAQSVSVNYTNSFGCTGITPALANVTVNPLPSPAGIISGIASVCQGQTAVSYSVPAIPNASSYVWAYSGMGAVITGAGNSVIVDFSTSATGGNLTVYGVNACGDGPISAVYPVTVNNLPVQPANFTTAKTLVCQGENNVIYTVPNDPSVTYTWTYSGTGATINGTTNSVTVNFAPTATSGDLSVTASNGCGTSAARTIAITVDFLPGAAGTITGTSSVCRGQTGVSYTVPAIPYAATYTWTYSGTGVTINGNTNAITIDFGAAAVSGNLTVRGTNSCGNGAVSAVYAINITPDNTIVLSSPAGTDGQSVCINTAIANISYTTTGATGATFGGLPAGVTGNWAANTATITGTPTVSGNFNYTVTLTGGCGTVTSSGTINVSPVNTITLTSLPATASQTVCINSPIASITYSTTGATGATISGLPTGVTGAWAANAVTISGTPSSSGLFNYTVTLTGGCGTATGTGTITVTQNNTIALTSLPATTSQTVCINTAITNITYNTTGATGATITGLPAGINGSWSANTITISGAPTVSGAFSYTITLTGGCGTITETGSVTVTPNNTITLTSGLPTENQSVCNNAPIANITYSTTGATGATFTGLPTGVSGSWLAGVATISGTPTAAGNFAYSVNLTGGCGTVSANGTLTVATNNTVTLTSGPGTDSQTICVNTPITGITYATTGATGATVSGLPAGVTGSWSANVVTISGSPSVSGTHNYTVALTGGCGNVSVTGTINSTSENTIALTSAAGTDGQTICLGDAITTITYVTTGATGASFTGLPTGMMVGWAANTVTISGTPSSTGSYSYTINLTGGCGTVSTSGTLTVLPLNSITLTSGAGTDNQTTCINTAITSITYSTSGATGVVISGLPAGVTGNWAANVVTISGVPSVPGSFSYTVDLTGGCGTVSETATITVSADNTIALTSLPATAAQTVCINTAITNITYNTTGATGATITGLPAGVTGSWSANTVTISGSPTVSGVFSYTVTLTGGCGTVNASGSLSVTPANTINLTSAAGTDSQTICVNTILADITYATSGATGASVSGLPAGVTGNWAAGLLTISGTPTVSGTSNYTVTLSGGCGSVTATGTISVSPDNSVVLSSPAGTDSQTLCINSALTAITYATTGATGATVSGLPAGVTGSWAADVVTISGVPTISGLFTYTVNLTGGCGNVSATGTIAVSADNTIALTSGAGTDAQSLCINNLLTTITYSTTGATSATVSGLPAGVTGSWAAGVVTISGTPSVSGVYPYTVDLTGGCGSVSSTGLIAVNPENTIALISGVGTDNQTVCINSPIINIIYSTTGATGGSVSGLPAGVNGLWAADEMTITGIPTVQGVFSYTVTLTGGCGNVTASGTITIASDNTVTLTSAAGTDSQTLCINTPVNAITYSTTGATGATFGGLPAGVTGNWTAGIITISGTPSESGLFTYTVTLTGGCGNATASGTINVRHENTITLTSGPGTDNQTICIGDPIVMITYTTTIATGANFTGLPVGMTVAWAADVVTISGTPANPGVFTYQIELTGGCGTVSTSGTLTVLPANTATLTSAAGTDNQDACINEPIVDIVYTTSGATGATVSGLPTGVTGTLTGGILTIGGAPTASGLYSFTVTLTGGCGTVTANGTITVRDINTISLTSAAGTDNQSICEGATIADITYATTGASGAVVTGLPAGVTGNWAADVLTISGTPSETGTFNYTVMLSGGCGIISSEGVLQINPALTVTATISADSNPVCAGTTVNFLAVPVNGGTTPAYQWQVNGVNAGTNSNSFSYIPVNNDNVTVILTSSETCTIVNPVTSTAVIMTVNDLPAGTTTSADVKCFGQPTGSVDLTLTSGLLPVTYLWSNGATTEDLTNVVAGVYSVTITDDNNCNLVLSGTVNEPASALSGAVTSQNNVTVFGGNDGSVTVDGSGGTPPYLYSFEGGAFQASGTFSALTAGNYTVTVQDLNLCTFNVPVTITQPVVPLTGTITSQTNVLCFGNATGSVTVTGVDGAAPYEYSLNGGVYQSSGTFGNLSAGTYTVTVKDSYSSTFDVPVNITQPAAALTVATSVVNVTCHGAGDGIAVALPSGGTGVYSYSWNTSPVQTADTAKSLTPGSYSVTVTDANGCTISGSVSITEPAVLTVESSSTLAKCPDSEDGTVTLDISGGTGPYSIIWQNSNETTPSRTNVLPGVYNAVVTDANGCAAAASEEVGFIGTFECVVIPEILTPDPADGYNDEWIIRNIFIYPDAEVKVYSRWGKLIYHSKNPSAEPWKGRYSNGQLVPTDSYRYILDLHDGSRIRSGVISVIR